MGHGWLTGSKDGGNRRWYAKNEASLRPSFSAGLDYYHVLYTPYMGEPGQTRTRKLPLRS